MPWSGVVTGVTASTIKAPYLPGLAISYVNNSYGVTPAKTTGTHVGNAVFGVGHDVQKINIVLDGNLAKPSVIWRLTHPGYFI
jgi:hypothetical protein